MKAKPIVRGKLPFVKDRLPFVEDRQTLVNELRDILKEFQFIGDKNVILKARIDELLIKLQ